MTAQCSPRHTPLIRPRQRFAPLPLGMMQSHQGPCGVANTSRGAWFHARGRQNCLVNPLMSLCLRLLLRGRNSVPMMHLTAYCRLPLRQNCALASPIERHGQQILGQRSRPTSAMTGHSPCLACCLPLAMLPTCVRAKDDWARNEDGRHQTIYLT